MTEDHVLPELNKVVDIIVYFPNVVINALVSSALMASWVLLVINRMPGCRHETNLSKPFIFKRSLHVIYTFIYFISQNTFIMTIKT